MKCDIHHQKNAHPKASPTESNGVQQFQFQSSQFFLNITKSEMCMNLCMVAEKHDLNQTKLGFHTG